MKTINESFDDIVFENRNKSYGAYELRKKYTKRGTIALAISVFILFSAVGVPLIASIMKNDIYRKYIENNTVVTMTNVPVEKQEVAPPPPPPPPAPSKEIKFIAPKIVETLTDENEVFGTNDDFSGNANAPVDTTQYQEVAIVEPHGDQIVDEKPVEIFKVTEKPAYPGGDNALLKYIGENTKYPVPALEAGIEGTVYIRFVVAKSGEVGDAKVMRAVDPLLDQEALRVVNTLPKWTPGKINGTAVSVWFMIPVKFVLK